MDNIEKLKNTIKELEEKLVKATEKEQLLQNIPREVNSLLSNLNGFIFRCKNDANWTMEYISEGFAKISGYTAADIISNKNISYSSLIHEDDQEKVWNDVQKAINRKKKWLLNYRLVNKKGHIAWVWEQGEGVFNKKGELEYLEGVIIDVTEKHEIEEKFAKNEFKYREIFNNIIDVYYEATIDGLILEISPSIKSIVGFSRKHMIGRNTSDFYADKNQREQLISELLINKSIKNYELVLIDKNGDHVNCYTSIVLLCD
ncbi:MAG: PAS domain S-box protein, partial [Bacteroidetes bacterium]|nr:PAS domain S-box protein [Bacteroidota bacterium]